MLSTYAQNAILNALVDKVGGDFGQLSSAPTLYAALVGDMPVVGDTGGTIDEATYSSYARIAVATGDFGAPASGVIANTAQKLFPQATGGSFTAKRVAFCDALTSGNLLFWGLLSPATLIEFEAITDDDKFYAGDHGLTLNTEVYLSGGNLPTGVDGDTKYYVVSVATDSFQLAASASGPAINITSDGDGYVGRDGSLQITNNVTPTIQIGALQIIAT